MPSILCSNARAPVAQLVRASDWNSEDPGSNPGRISMSFFTINVFHHQCFLPSMWPHVTEPTKHRMQCAGLLPLVLQ